MTTIMWFIAFFLIVIAILGFQQGRIWQKDNQIKQWKSNLKLDIHFALFQHLYRSIDGFVLSQQARKGKDAIDYVYGEIEFESFIALLSLCSPNRSTVFYDLGSGTGKAILASAMVFDLKKSCGIELFPSLSLCAEEQRQRLASYTDYAEKSNSIQFITANILDSSFSDASLVFINSTAFFGETWIKISKTIEQIKLGALVISTSKALASQQFKTIRVTEVAMSWGLTTAFIQQRL